MNESICEVFIAAAASVKSQKQWADSKVSNQKRVHTAFRPRQNDNKEKLRGAPRYLAAQSNTGTKQEKKLLFVSCFMNQG